jgi:hypothetical protein
MIWLDSLFAVPVVGVHMIPDFKEVFEFQKRIGNFLDFLAVDKPSQIAKFVIKPDEIWGYSISVRETGFSFVLRPQDIIGQYSYEIKHVPHPGSLPTFEPPTTMPYSQLLEKIFNYVQEFVSFIKDLKGFKYDRIGIVANIGSDKESLPPGVLEWIEHLSKPWRELIKSESLLLAKLQENEERGYRDQCHHILKFDDTTPEIGIRFTLDWQRFFKKPILISEAKGLSENLISCKNEALNYFQKFGEGDLNYE